MRCGLLGRKLSHSYSPLIHAQLGDYRYEFFEREPEELEAFLRSGDFAGLNVTVPYKKAVIPFLDALTPRAQRLGAVNTVVRRPDGTLVGHNTDYFGFETLLRASGLTVHGKKALVLGSGGASMPVRAVLREAGAEVIVISRSGDNNYGNLSRHADASVIVNTTPVGMYPEVGRSPVNLAEFPALDGVLDIIFNPARTQLLLDAEERGLPAVNGLMMLVAQAKESAEWFMGCSLPDDRIGDIYAALRCQTENVILIGMPGSGKTTVGRLLARTLGRPFVDADAEIEKATGQSIASIFASGGESAFRMQETKVLAKYGMQSGLVIATGGGCVTQARNYPLLHQNGTIFCLHRALGKLPCEGRPLSLTNPLPVLYAARKPLYAAFADYEIDNNGTISDAAGQIRRILEGNI